MPLPIFKLPDLLFENVYGHLEFKDLIYLSSCSKRMKSIIQSMESTQDKVISLKKDEKEKRFCLTLKKGREEFALYLADKLYNIEMEHWKKEKERKIAGRTWKTYEEECKVFIVQQDYNEAVLFWYKYLKDLFNCPAQIHLEFGTKHSDFEPLLVNTSLLHVADKILIAFDTEVSDFRMNHMMDNLNAKELSIYARPRREFKSDKIITRCPVIIFGTCPWLSMEDSWKMFQGGVCRQLSCTTYTHWCQEDVYQLIRNWLDSDNITFELISFSVPFWAVSLFENRVIFNGITTTPGCKKREDAAEYFDKRQPYEEGWDIRRKDGLLATLVKNERSGKISFTVWYCLDPNVPADNN